MTADTSSNRVDMDIIKLGGYTLRVSTINRDEATEEGGRFAETLVFDEAQKPFGKIIDSGTAPEGCRTTHDELLQKWTDIALLNAQGAQKIMQAAPHCKSSAGDHLAWQTTQTATTEAR